VNPVDLIALEVIRLYEPDVYQALRSSKELLTASSRPDKLRSEVAGKAVASLIELGSEGRKGEVRELLKHLFPTILMGAWGATVRTGVRAGMVSRAAYLFR